MSRPRFLADHDLTEAIVLGVLRREPAIEFHRIRDVGRSHLADPDVLAYAASEGLLVVSHDVNSMSGRRGPARRRDAVCGSIFGASKRSGRLGN